MSTYFLDAVDELGGCPADLVTNLGTENGLMAVAQAFFRDDENSHRYVPSPRNQRIESWWAQYSKSSASWWINFFKDLVDEQMLDTTSELDMECLWFWFSGVLQKELDEIKEHWNTHYIRKSRHIAVCGRPDSLYFLPEMHGGTCNLSLPVPKCEMDYLHSHVVEINNENECEEYCHYVSQACNLPQPENWREALQQYHTIIFFVVLEIKSL